MVFSGGRVAVVASAWQKVQLVDGGNNLLSKLVQPLGADLLLVLTYRWDDGCNSTQSCRLHERLSFIWPAITRLSLEAMLTISELLNTLERLPHRPAILHAANLTRHAQGITSAGRRATLYNTCVRDQSWGATTDVGFDQQTRKGFV